MNEKTEKQLKSIVSEQLKDIEKLEIKKKEITKTITELKKDNKKLSSILTKNQEKEENNIMN